MSTERTAPFEFITENEHAKFRVVSLAAVEEANDIYHVNVVLAVAADAGLLENLEPNLLGHPAAVVISAGEARRRLHGIVRSFRIDDFDAREARIHVEIVPRLALLKLRRQSRIFQNRTVREIVSTVLDEWRIEYSFELMGQYNPRPYSTQHEETDFDFVQRLLAAEGIGFYFAPSPPGAALTKAPEVVFYDSDSGYGVIGAAETARHHRGRKSTVLRHSTHNFEHGDNDVQDFTLRRGLAHKSVVLGDFDFRRPQFGLRAGSDTQSLATPPSSTEKGEAFDANYYRELSEQGTGPAQIDADKATRALEQLRRDAWVGHGKTRSGRLLPGHLFTLEDHPIDGLNQDYVVTRIEHKGRGIESLDDKSEVYSASFTCIPAGVVYRPPFDRALRRVYGNETATVVGPPGEQIYTDMYGRVKVRFHWDHDAKGDDSSSCWLRASQGWAGQRWGMQFIPRVGMEVMVTFLGGDADRPVVTGCLYNATHPTPFTAPGDRYRSGVRTNSSSGYNELSFDDRSGEEQILMRAQRDLEVTVGNDASTEIERNEQHRVRGSLELSVDGKRTDVVGGDLELSVAGGLSTSLKGDHDLKVAGDHRAAFNGDSNHDVSGAMNTNVGGRVQAKLGDRLDVTVTEDTVVRSQGHLVAIVGENDAQRSATIHVEGSSEIYATTSTEIIAEKGLVLRVGDTSIRMTPNSIELGADTIIFRGTNVYALADDTMKLMAKKQGLFASDKKIFLQAEQGSLQLTKDARVDGATVKLNCSPDPVDSTTPDKKDIQKTQFSLVDDDGKPMVGQRFILVMPDGSERSGVLDENGKAELEVEDSGDIVFPDVSKPQPA